MILRPWTINSVRKFQSGITIRVSRTISWRNQQCYFDCGLSERIDKTMQFAGITFVEGRNYMESRGSLPNRLSCALHLHRCFADGLAPTCVAHSSINVLRLVTLAANNATIHRSRFYLIPSNDSNRSKVIVQP